MASAFLLIIGHREGLSWIIDSGRMAFPSNRDPVLRKLANGDQLYLYITRSCFMNPSMTVGRVVGTATVTSTVTGLSDPIKITGRTLSCGCDLHIDSLTEFGQGIPLRNFTTKMDAFRENPAAWSAKLRRTILPLSPHDSAFLTENLTPIACDPADVREPYLQWLP